MKLLVFYFRLEQEWVEVTVDSQVDALIDAVKKGLKPERLSRTMVFANTVEAVESVAQILSRAGIECFLYHSDSPLDERTRNLVDFQQRGGVLVCTDAAARGLDIHNVSHVIQVLSFQYPISILLHIFPRMFFFLLLVNKKTFLDAK